MKPAVFLDRDGVLIENVPGYVRTWADVEVFEQAVDAVLRLNASPYEVVVVTNQSAPGRGLIPLEDIMALNQRILGEFEGRGARFAGSYLCPHAPEEECDCRKPQPGMLLAAGRELNLDMSNSYMVGDAVTDIDAGEAAGVKPILVRTGRGKAESERMGARSCPVVKDVSEAVDLILGAKR